MLGLLRGLALPVAIVVAAALVGPASAFALCPNEAFRTGRSASLPDCRAYELVTPKELGRTGSLTFEESRDKALPSSDGEHFALETFGSFFEPDVSVRGTVAVFSRTPSGWVMTPVPTPASTAEAIELQLFSTNLSEVGFSYIDGLTQGHVTLVYGPTGGPYTTVASVSGTIREIEETALSGANRGTATVPAFSDILLQSADHTLLSPGPEREAAEQARPGTLLLYEFANGELRLVNVDDEGKLLSPCGGRLGYSTGGGQAMNAVSDDGSKVFFSSPAVHEPGCLQPALYMRVNGRETVDVSEPQGVAVPPAARDEVTYDGASSDGSKVFFTTATALTPAAVSQPGSKLYEYDTEAPYEHRLTVIASEVEPAGREFINPYVVVAEDGTVVYYEGGGAVDVGGHSVSVSGIWYYNTVTRRPPSFVATPRETTSLAEPSYTTPQGEFLVFPSGRGGTEVMGAHGLEEEYRGAGHEELYRYDSIEGSVTCVSCGEGVAPARGSLSVPEEFTSIFVINDGAATVISISDDGQRVFFQTSARLVPQDTNEDSSEEEEATVTAPIGAGADVYEWEQVGTEEAPGVFCRVSVGCTHLISAGEAVGPERFLGASASGNDVFFTSAAQLVPQATPEFTNIYDARVDGGFAPPPTTAECTSCQGVGSPPPQFGAGATLTLTGLGNPTAAAGSSAAPRAKPKPKPKRGCKRGYKRNRKGKCVHAASRKGGGRS